MKQKDIFMQGAGDAWLNRNRNQLGLHDPVTELIIKLGLKPTSVLEVGCADGWRLEQLRMKFGARVHGVEPSMEAGIEAAERRVPVHQMTASCLPVVDGGFDMVIYGFCLYVTDPEDWLLIASEGDRALRAGGHIIIHDFAAPGETYSVRYEHDDRVLSHHFDFQRLWLAHPRYERVGGFRSSANEHVVALRKRTDLQRFS